MGKQNKRTVLLANAGEVTQEMEDKRDELKQRMINRDTSYVGHDEYLKREWMTQKKLSLVAELMKESREISESRNPERSNEDRWFIKNSSGKNIELSFRSHNRPDAIVF